MLILGLNSKCSEFLVEYLSDPKVHSKDTEVDKQRKFREL